MRVLVLEDNETSRFVIQAVLERAGYQCLLAENAAAAGRLLADQPVDLAVVDAILRDERSPQVTQIVEEILPDVPVLYISGFPLEHLERQGIIPRHALRDPGAGFLQKPFSPEALLAAIDGLRERGRWRTETNAR